MNKEHRFAVAPMMDRTDRHCRFFHRQLSRNALLFTEMITADAVINGDRSALLGIHPEEHPVALQLGGPDPKSLAEAARIGADFGFDEINLNVGCPSDRVKSGSFGACLMLEPRKVAECIAAMVTAVDIPVTVKCRLGVDDQDTEKALDSFADMIVDAGADGLWVHARKAWLSGLSPKENRSIPPLDHSRVYRLKKCLPNVFVGVNGGLEGIAACVRHVGSVDGVMVGRAAYDRPEILTSVDRLLYGASGEEAVLTDVVAAMIDYADRQSADGVPLARVARPMLGLFRATPGAREWRRALTVGGADGAGGGVIRAALSAWTAVQNRNSHSRSFVAA